ncbi:MAG: hypothetical protein QOG68_2426 [Solirubrobacteraceae bacterium]|nr:hypothetical protein [Solirubrobacteraceae bacterium]
MSRHTPQPRRSERGQTLVLLLAALLVVVIGAIVAGAIAHGIGTRSDEQRAADLGALAGARAMRSAYPRLFEPPLIDDRPNPSHLDRGAYLALGASAARTTAARNGAHRIAVGFPGADPLAPTRIRVAVADPIEVKGAGRAAVRVSADAELAPPASAASPGAGQGEYRGPFAYRQGKPMRPDTAQAFDRLDAAARAAGLPLIVVSGFRGYAEQAALFAAHPDPKWVAPPGKSLHRLGTELDLGPPSAYPWLYANAPRFHFIKRYSCELAGISLRVSARSGGASSPSRSSRIPHVPCSNSSWLTMRCAVAAERIGWIVTRGSRPSRTASFGAGTRT